MSTAIDFPSDPVEPGSDGLYPAAEVARLLAVPESRLRYWSHTGFIAPTARHGGRRFYSFQDLIAVKVAKALLDDGQPLQRVRRSLAALRGSLPHVTAPLVRLRVRGDRDRIIVDDGTTRFDAGTGQLLLDFELSALRQDAAEIHALPWVETPADEAAEVGASGALSAFVDALSKDRSWDGADIGSPQYSAAIAAYEATLELDAEFAAAWTNLGRLLARAGDLDGARDHFDRAIACDPQQPEARCNLAELALQESQHDLALLGYRNVLRSTPDHYEAHYGAARALLALGSRAQARAHLERFCSALQATDFADAEEDDPLLTARRTAALQWLAALDEPRS